MSIERPARIKKWRDEYYVFYRDHGDLDELGLPREKRLRCKAKNASNREERKELVDQIRLEQHTILSSLEDNNVEDGTTSILADELDEFIADVQRRKEVRESNPESRRGLAKDSAYRLTNTVTQFAAWVDKKYKGLRTGQLTPVIVEQFIDVLASEPGRVGKKTKIQRSQASINGHIRNLKSCLFWVDDLEPARFINTRKLIKKLKPARVSSPTPSSIRPQDLISYCGEFVGYESEIQKNNIYRRKWGKVEVFTQSVSTSSKTSLIVLFLMYALTGARRGEILNLKWSDIDLINGHIHIYADKTGQRRILPLIGAPEGEIAPLFFKLLNRWETQKTTEFIVPTSDGYRPSFPKNIWYRLSRSLKAHITPQGLRQNFTSYAASLGIPAAVCAMWQGHGLAVAERHYRAQVMSRMKGATFEQAMGLDIVIRQLLAQ